MSEREIETTDTALAFVRAQRDYERAKAATEVCRRAEEAVAARLHEARQAREKWEEAALHVAWRNMEKADAGQD